jgi:hypothetical protein
MSALARTGLRAHQLNDADASDRRQAVPPEGPAREVALKLPTFGATAEMAGISRVMGGYHIQ